MSIDCSKLIHNRASQISIDETIAIDVAVFKDDRLLDGGPLEIEGEARRVDEGIYLDGSYRLPLTMACDRCLQPVTEEVTGEIDLLLEENSEKWRETLKGETLDLASLLYEDLLLGMPSKVLCDEGCRGLCPVCGTDLNASTCDCETESVDPRLAALKDFFKED
jgi:uncharacterized protein